MSGGISAITLPAGYLGSSLIGALLIFCGFDIVGFSSFFFLFFEARVGFDLGFEWDRWHQKSLLSL